MGIELASLEIPIVVPGLDQAHRGLQTLDTDGQRAARGLEMAADSVAGFTAEARLGTDRMVHAIEVLGAQLTTTKRTTKDTGDEFGRTGDRARGLTVALRDIGRGGTAGLDAMARRVREFTEGLQHASTRAASIAGLERQEAALTRALAAGNLTTGQRIRLEGERKRVQDALQLPRLEAAEAALRRQLEAGNLSLRQRIRLRRELRAAESATQAARGGAVAAGVAAGGMSGVLGAVGVAVGAGTGITAANRAADAYDRAEAAQRKLSATSRLTGASLAFVSGTAKDLERDLQLPAPVAGDLTAVMVRLASRAGDVTQSGTAIRRVLDLAAASGYGASEAIEAITAAMTGSDEQLNRLGLANPQQIYEEWARAAGTTAAKMTDAQKSQAILSALVREGAKVEGEYARRLDTSAGLTEKRQQATEKAFASIGQALAPLRDLLNKALTEVADFAKEWPKVTSAIVGVGGALLAIETVTRAVKALTVAQTANAAVSTSKFLPALRAIGAFLASPAGALVLALAGAGGVVAFAQGQENKRERAPREAADKAAAALTPEQASASLTAAKQKRDALFAEMRAAAPRQGMSGEEVEAANRRVAQLQREKTLVDALVVAYRNKTKEMFADVEGGGAPKRQAKSKEELDAEADAAAKAAEDALRITQAGIAQREQTNAAGYEAGRRSLAAYYAERESITRAGISAELRALRQERAARAGEKPAKPEDVVKQRAEVASLDAQIRARRLKGETELAALRQQREQAERASAQRIIGFGAEVQAARGQHHAAELAQIAERTREYRIALAQEGRLTAEQQADAVRVFRTTAEAQADAAQAQREIAREQATLEARRAEIRVQVAKGTLTEMEGAQQIAAAERERLPALQALVGVVERVAAVLGNPELKAAAVAVRAELAGWGAALTPFQQRINAVLNELATRGTATAAAARAKIDEMLANVGGAAAPIALSIPITPEIELIGNLADQVDAEFAGVMPNIVGLLGNTLGAAFSGGMGDAGNVLLAGLGGIMQQMGGALLQYGAAMTGLLPALTNPFTSGPAAMIAGGLLIAAGAALGAIASKGRGGGGGGGGSFSAPASFDQSASVILTPRAAARGSDPRGALAPAAPTQPGLAPSAQLRPITNVWHLMNPADPATQRIVREANRGGERRGIR